LELNESEAVAQLSEILSLERGYDRNSAARIRNAASLHDVGKSTIPRNILYKPGKLNAREFAVMKTHTLNGVRLLSELHGEAVDDFTAKVCLFHHEWYDPALGGYWGVPVDSLPDYVAIVSICDVLVALLSNRVYKHAWPPNEAVRHITNQSGTQFSPGLVNDFISLVRNDNRVPVVFADLYPDGINAMFNGMA
jgi:putative two-component system response regulator